MRFQDISFTLEHAPQVKPLVDLLNAGRELEQRVNAVYAGRENAKETIDGVLARLLSLEKCREAQGKLGEMRLDDLREFTYLGVPLVNVIGDFAARLKVLEAREQPEWPGFALKTPANKQPEPDTEPARESEVELDLRAIFKRLQVLEEHVLPPELTRPGPEESAALRVARAVKARCGEHGTCRSCAAWEPIGKRCLASEAIREFEGRGDE